jgi:RNA polymerase sigma-70 factor (sigma-E family)
MVSPAASSWTAGGFAEAQRFGRRPAVVWSDLYRRTRRAEPCKNAMNDPDASLTSAEPDLLPALPSQTYAKGSFIALYEEAFPSMVRLAIALTGSEELAEDLVHDAFVRVHARWEHVESPRAYLRTAVVNACRSARRRSRRERLALSSQAAGPTSFVADELFDALGQLPYRQRAALVLQYYEGLTQAEIATVLGCREGTVASLVHRGLAQLRRVIKT